MKIEFIDYRMDQNAPLPSVEALIIDGVEINYYSAYDGKPIKTQIPSELRERLKTKKQWDELGFTPKSNAVKYEMHPTCMNKKLCEYFLDDDVEEQIECPDACVCCRFNTGMRCEIFDDFVGETKVCVERSLIR